MFKTVTSDIILRKTIIFIILKTKLKVQNESLIF